MKKTKIVCTIGPASESYETLVALINAGMNVARLNFSHGDHAEHLERINRIRKAEEETGQKVGILLDTKGPEIRTHKMENDGFVLEVGKIVRISMEEVLGTPERFSITYDNLIHEVDPGDTILVDDGLITLEVTEIDLDNKDIVTIVKNSGPIKNNKGVNVPGVSVKLPGLTEKDIADIRFGLENKVDFIAPSFVRNAENVLEIVELLEEYDMRNVKIIPKIENQEGVDNAEEILRVSDGMMVARGDLGVEIPTEEVPIVQKDLIAKCNAVGKPVITATQMLDSMQNNPRPTRAEAGDVANAIFDGTDAVMLSGETAAGKYPVESVQTMANIAIRTEEAQVNQDAFTLKAFDKQDTTEAIGQAVGHTAKNLDVGTIVAATSSGYTARMISKYRPKANIIALTFSSETARGLLLQWGVIPVVVEAPASTDDMFDLAEEVVKENNYVEDGDLVLITAGVPVGQTGTTNLMKISMIGDILAEGTGVGVETVSGRAVVAKSAEEANEKMVEGGVLVATSTDRDYLPALEKAAAIVVEQDGLTSHAAVVGIAMGIPVIVGADRATETIKDGLTISVSGRRGVVYSGKTDIV